MADRDERLPDPRTAGGETGKRIDWFVSELFAPEDEHLIRIRRSMLDRELPTIQLPRSTARTAQLLLRMVGARRVLEVGALAGYSALWIVRALPADGRFLTLDVDPDRVALALENLRASGFEKGIEGRAGDAAELLSQLGPPASWDAVFLDADKEGLPGYVHEARRLLSPGGLLLVDNALWQERVLDPEASDPATRGIRTALDAVARDPGFDAMLLPVGDGLLVARRTQE